MKPFARLTLALALGIASTPYLLAGEPHHAGAHDGPAAGTAAPESALSEGEVRNVNKGAGKLTIKHGELKNLEMPPMTMVFRVKEPAMLDQVKAGDKIQFVADKIEGKITVTRIEAR